MSAFFAIGFNAEGAVWPIEYSVEPEFLPAGQVACTAEQYNNYRSYRVVDGALAAADPDVLLDKAKTRQLEMLQNNCAASIVAGFESDALGKAHTYGSTITDQANLTANVLSSLLPGLADDWTTLQLCADADGVWQYREHTAAQIQQVGADAKTAILGYLTKKAQLSAQVEQSTAAPAVAAIVW